MNLYTPKFIWKSNSLSMVNIINKFVGPKNCNFYAGTAYILNTSASIFCNVADI
jgi:hypothetical protein